MQNNNLDVSVVMCAYTLDRWSDLHHSIQSVRSQTVPPREIILVIDHNKALFELAGATFKDVVVIENHETRGLSGSRNSGIARSSSPVIAFIDEDAIAAPNWIESLLAGYRDPTVIGVGGEVKPAWVVAQPDWFPEEFGWVVGCSYKGLPLELSPVRNPIGCNMSFRREALVSAGGFRNGIGRIGKVPVGCEETELCIRARQSSPMSTLLYQPSAVVFHNVPEWRASWNYFASRCYAEGLSKALVTRFVGSKDGLSSERQYVLNTLPLGILDGLKATFFHGKLSGIKRSLAITVGLVLTTIGYLVGVAGRAKDKHSSGSEGLWIAAVEKKLEEN